MAFLRLSVLLYVIYAKRNKKRRCNTLQIDIVLLIFISLLRQQPYNNRHLFAYSSFFKYVCKHKKKSQARTYAHTLAGIAIIKENNDNNRKQ